MIIRRSVMVRSHSTGCRVAAFRRHALIERRVDGALADVSLERAGVFRVADRLLTDAELRSSDLRVHVVNRLLEIADFRVDALHLLGLDDVLLALLESLDFLVTLGLERLPSSAASCSSMAFGSLASART
jgi:hypothetical protein